MKNILLIFVIVMMSGLSSCAQSSPEGDKRAAGEKAVRAEAVPVKWYPYREGMALAREKGRPVLMDFYAVWCGWCRRMDNEVFADPEVSAKLAEKYVCVRIHTDANYGETIRYKNHLMTKEEFMAMLGVQGLPTLVFLDKEGNLITRVPGFVPKELMLPLLGYIEKECYLKKVSFNDYMNDKSACGEKR